MDWAYIFVEFLKKKIIEVRTWGKKKGREKISEISVTFDNLEKMGEFF